jgi:hypothetical protein
MSVQLRIGGLILHLSCVLSVCTTALPAPIVLDALLAVKVSLIDNSMAAVDALQWLAFMMMARALWLKHVRVIVRLVSHQEPAALVV